MGAPVTRVDVGTLQQALTQMLRLDAARCHLIVAITVENVSPEQVAADVGLEPSRALDELRASLDALARLYEEQAWLALGEGDEALYRKARTARALAGKRG